MSSPVVIVTGCSRGLGLAVTQILLEEMSSSVIGIARKENEALEELEEKYPKTYRTVLGDITEPSTSAQAVKAALDKFGHLDALVLNAGILDPMGPISTIAVDSAPSSTNPSSWKSHFETNFFSLIHTIHESLAPLRASKLGGRIVCVSSGAAVKGNYGWGPYNASKAAMNSLVRTLATEEPELTVVAIRPGTVDTDMQGQVRSSHRLREEDIKPFKDLHTSGKLLDPKDPGFVLSALAIASKERLEDAGREKGGLSGGFWNWNGEECKPFMRGEFEVEEELPRAC